MDIGDSYRNMHILKCVIAQGLQTVSGHITVPHSTFILQNSLTSLNTPGLLIEIQVLVPYFIGLFHS